MTMKDGTFIDVRSSDDRSISRGWDEPGDVVVAIDGEARTFHYSDAIRIADALVEAAKDAKYYAKR